MITHLRKTQRPACNVLRHLASSVLGLYLVLGCSTLSPAADSAGITGVSEEGRIIFRNDEAVPKPEFNSVAPAALPAIAIGAARKTAARGIVKRINSHNPAQKIDATAGLPVISAQLVPQQSPGDLVYWSKQERRWKQVPRISNATMRRAISAASEIRAEAHPTQRLSRGQRVSSQPLAASATGSNLDAAIDEAAARHQVDPDLVRALIQVESNFNPRARSPKGAMGLMQLMPATARSLNVRNAFDARQNLDGGVRHLAGLLQDFDGNVELSLAAYNAGAGAVQRHNGIPPYAETQNYVRRITAIYGQHGAPFTSSSAAAASAPIRMFRDAAGHTLFSNAE